MLNLICSKNFLNAPGRSGNSNLNTLSFLTVDLPPTRYLAWDLANSFVDKSSGCIFFLRISERMAASSSCRCWCGERMGVEVPFVGRLVVGVGVGEGEER